MLRVKKSGDFEDMLRELDKNPEIYKSVRDRIKIFRKNPKDTRLSNHALTKRMKGKFAFSITEDIRIVYEWLGKNSVRFLAIGGHPKVYQRS